SKTVFCHSYILILQVGLLQYSFLQFQNNCL
ncbi:Speckle-type POZ protein, partial [Araneus ventricosus]